MIVKIIRQYVVDGRVSELHECDMFRFTDPEGGKHSEELKPQGEIKVYVGSLYKGDKITELTFMSGDSIYVMEDGKTVDSWFIPEASHGSRSTK